MDICTFQAKYDQLAEPLRAFVRRDIDGALELAQQ